MIQLLALINFVGYYFYWVVSFKLGKQETRFWDYVYMRSLKRMHARSYTLAFLVGDAYNYRKYDDVCRVCDAFAIRNDELANSFNEKIAFSATRAGRQDLVEKFAEKRLL